MARQTPSQTVGPFFAYALTPELYGRKGIAGNVVAGDTTTGELIRVEGRVLDGDDTPIRDAIVEIWQADADGRYAHPADSRHQEVADSFRGFGRSGTDEDGRFWFITIKPGCVPGPGNTLQVPHLNVILLMRGLLSHVFTRLYFEDEVEANGSDPVLGAVEAARRGTMIAARSERHGTTVYSVDIRMQGSEETVFFDA